MRRKDNEITDWNEIEKIIQSAKVCHLALADGSQPYVVPLNFGYQDKTVYFHSAAEGRKIEMLRANPRVCVEFSLPLDLVRAEKSCEWGQAFKSVIGFGTARFIEDSAVKRAALDMILAHYGVSGGAYSDKRVTMTAVIAVALTEITGKRSG